MDAPPTDAPADPAAEPASYEAALAELESWVGAMESGKLPLDRMLEAYQRGAHLLAYCRAQLAEVEQQVKVLDEGTLKAWEDA